MGEATDRKLNEIADTRRRLEADIRELEDRLPAPVRSAKAMVGAVVGSSALSALALRMLKRRRNHRSGTNGATEVVVRVVREDERPAAEHR